jgi:hypothetical protein
VHGDREPQLGLRLGEAAHPLQCLAECEQRVVVGRVELDHPPKSHLGPSELGRDEVRATGEQMYRRLVRLRLEDRGQHSEGVQGPALRHQRLSAAERLEGVLGVSGHGVHNATRGTGVPEDP